MSARPLLPLLSLPLLFLLGACGGPSVEERHNEAQALLEKDPAAAEIAAENALKEPSISGDAKAAWRFEQIAAEAEAKGKKGTEVVARLERLAGSNPKQVDAKLYRAMADKLKEAGDNTGAIDVLSAGDKRFPAEHDSFVKAIDALKSSGDLDPDEVEKLKALGYL